MKKFMFLLILLIFVQPLKSQPLKKNAWLLTPPKQKLGLAGNGITDIVIQEFEGSEIIWVETGSGLSRMRVGTDLWISYGEEQGFGKGGVSAFAIKEDIIWVATVFDSLISEENLDVGGGLAYSLDGGINWTYVPQPGVTPVQNTTWDIEIVESTVWIASFGGGLQKSEDYGNTWQIVPPDEFNFDPDEYLNHRVFSLLEVDGVFWVGTAGGINKTVDGGRTWVNFNHQNQEHPISGNWVIAIANQKYENKDILWAVTRETTVESEDTTEFRGVSKSEDQGYTWETYLEGETAWDFAFDDSVVYVCTDNGLFKSIDGGETWALFPSYIDLEADERVYANTVYSAGISGGHTLWVGTADGLAKTEDNGLTWKIYRAFAPTGRLGEPRTYAYPNPFSPLRHNQLGGDGYVRFQYNTRNPTKVTIRIFDFAMDLVTTVVKDKPRPASGDFAEVWNGKTDDGKLLANGVYFYQLTLDGDGTYWGKIMILD